MERGNKNYIELQDKGESKVMQITAEENRKIKSREMMNLQYILSSDSKITKYTWEEDGERIINGEGKVFFTREDKKILKYLLLQKLPEKHRAKLWLIASGAKREITNSRHYYSNLVKNFPECIPSPYENQIQMDLHRTFPGDPFFEKEENIEKLKNLLIAYSRRNISIGYCQGFNFIAGRLLKMFKSEEEAFWVFVQLIENILPINSYSELAGIMIDCAILINLVKGYLPSLYNHLVEIGYEMCLSNVLYKWFVSIFIQNLNYDLSLTVWDMLMLEGNIVMFKASIGILKVLRNSILAKQSMEEINHVFDEETKHLNDHSVLVYYLILQKFEFDYEFICKSRLNFQSTILDSINLNNNYRKSKLLEEEKNCNKGDYSNRRRASYVKNVVECYREWPLCIYDLGYKYNVITHLVLRVHDTPKLIEDYFENESGYKRDKGLGVGKSSNNTKLKCISSNSNNHHIRRKSSRSSEGFHKVYLESAIFDSKVNTNTNNINSQNNNHNYSSNSPRCYSPSNTLDNEIKMEIYRNLLIERRQHLCPERELPLSHLNKNENLLDNEEDNEIILNSDFEISHSYVKVKEEDNSGSNSNESDLSKKSKIKDLISNSKSRRSQSMIRTSHFKFPVKDSISFEDNYNYTKLLSNLTNSEENIKIFETFKPKPLLEIEDYVFEENPFKNK